MANTRAGVARWRDTCIVGIALLNVSTADALEFVPDQQRRISPIGSIETVALSSTGQAAAVPVGLPVSDLNPDASLTTGPLIAACYVLGSAGVYPELVRYE